MPRYDVSTKTGPLTERQFVRSVRQKSHAIEIADDLVERDRHHAAFVNTDRGWVCYSRFRDPTWCAHRGVELPLHRNRAYLWLVKGDDHRQFHTRTDTEMEEIAERAVRLGFTPMRKLTIREVNEILHENATNLRDEWRHVPF